MTLTLNNLAKEYKLLPSEALSRATTFDLYVLDLGTKWTNLQHDRANGKIEKPKLTQEQMMSMINSVKERKRD